MKTYRFETTVLENGMIKIPDSKKYENKMVEVFLILKPQKDETQKEKKVKNFLDQWYGFFSEIKTEDIRYNSIIEKHK